VSKIRTSLLSVLCFLTLAPLAKAQEAEPLRKYGLGLGLESSRTWSSVGERADHLKAQGSLLFLNENFHFGPAVSFERTYSGPYGMSAWSIGAQSKWTYENLQTADRTPFVTLGGHVRNMEVAELTFSDMQVATGIGYEMFLSPKVSLAQSINWQKTWFKQKPEPMEYDLEEYVFNQSSVSLRLDLTIYL
jgi:hypothetical protein